MFRLQNRKGYVCVILFLICKRSLQPVTFFPILTYPTIYGKQMYKMNVWTSPSTEQISLKQLQWCSLMILSWCLWNLLTSANQINQIWSCDRSRILIPDVGGTGVWPGKNSFHRNCKQDRRWNADKPSAALDPYIPTWLTTSPANHRPANFFFFFLHSKEIVKSGATSGPTDEHQLQISSSHSLTLSSTNNHQHYLLGSSIYNGHVKHIFTLCHSRQINVATWFLVFPIDIENKSTIENIDIYMHI